MLQDITEEDNVIQWKRTYKRLIKSVYKEADKQRDWRIAGLPDARFRLYQCQRGYYKVEGDVYCKYSQLVAMLEDYDFKRRHEWGDLLYGHSDWTPVETLCSQTFGNLHVVKCNPGTYRVFWSLCNARTQTWVYISCVCNYRNDLPKHAPNVHEQWTCIILQAGLDPHETYGDRTYVRIITYNEPPCIRDHIILSDQLEVLETFGRNAAKWDMLYSETARVARDLERRELK